MVYNPRMSIAPSSQQSRTTRKREDEVDAFMRLSDQEIVGCITDIGIPFSVADLQKPNPVQVQQIYEWFADVLMNANRQTVEPCMRAAAEDVAGDYVDCFPADTRNLLGFYMSLRKLLDEVGIHDFSFNDLFKPTHDRLNRIFSYVINFVRFRESQTAMIEKYYNGAQNIKTRIGELYNENQAAEDRLIEMKRNRRAMETQVRERTQRNEELKRQLLELRRNQERVAARLEEAKTKKNELTAMLEEKTAQRLVLKAEATKLRPYTLQSPQALQQALTDLTNTLSADKAHIDALDRRARGLQTSIDSFGVVSTDVASCIKLLDDISGELTKEEDENAKNTRQRDALSERGNNVKEVERTEALLQRQLQKWNERTEKLRETSTAKAAEAKERMTELKKVYKKLTEENTERGREMERQRVRIEQTEKKMLDLKENIENEVHGAYDEYLKMEAHIKLYITEMEQTLPS